jgi:hypothetical protein
VDVERSEAKIAATADPAKAHMAGVNEVQRAVHRVAATPPPLAGDPGARNTPPDSRNATYMQAKTAREVYDAKMAQLEYEQASGKLIEVAAVKNQVAAVLSSLREALMQIPARMSPVVAAESDAGKVHEMLTAELHQALEQFTALATQMGAKA